MLFYHYNIMPKTFPISGEYYLQHKFYGSYVIFDQ